MRGWSCYSLTIHWPWVCVLSKQNVKRWKKLVQVSSSSSSSLPCGIFFLSRPSILNHFSLPSFSSSLSLPLSPFTLCEGSWREGGHESWWERKFILVFSMEKFIEREDVKDMLRWSPLSLHITFYPSFLPSLSPSLTLLLYLLSNWKAEKQREREEEKSWSAK